MLRLVTFLAVLTGTTATHDNHLHCSVGGRWGLADDDSASGTSRTRVQFRINEALEVPTGAVPVGGAGTGPTSKTCDTSGAGIDCAYNQTSGSMSLSNRAGYVVAMGRGG